MARFNSLKELKQYEEFHKRQKRKAEEIRKSLGATTEELKKNNIFFVGEETREKIFWEEMERERERLTEEYINKEVERRLKEQQPSEKQIEKELEKTIDKALNNLKFK